MRTETKWAGAGLSLLVAICFVCLCACGGKGEDKTDAGKEETAAKVDTKPKIVAVESKYDFGKVKQGVEVEHIFKIKNEGGADLKIEKARGS
jgi:hypothetical protein